ncbi:MAG: hypothetical protein CVV23_05930 [Ignavibacteriae bacterium HGW-Ignavibacteriae-2]|jgi:flagellar basal-body rod protein FlgG|nr:MAG: hypothetical protein CVV23_05930 [Ignavibacteriae bacterium HGW-Ignavibacteriae-2]
MIKGIFMAARSLQSGEQHISVVANNLANINTNGFKREVPFAEILDKEGNLVVNQITDQKQGELVSTSNPLDVALKGDGFFVVKTEDGQELTRDGRFNISNEGFLVNVNGQKVLSKSGEISFNQNIFDQKNSISISKTGEIKIGDTSVGELLIANVDDARLLKKAGNNNFISSDENYKTQDESNFDVIQGYLESANVNPVEEMEAMIRTNKDYQSSYKIVNYLDESLEKANQIGKV